MITDEDELLRELTRMARVEWPMGVVEMDATGVYLLRFPDADSDRLGANLEDARIELTRRLLAISQRRAAAAYWRPGRPLQ